MKEQVQALLDALTKKIPLLEDQLRRAVQRESEASTLRREVQEQLLEARRLVEAVGRWPRIYPPVLPPYQSASTELPPQRMGSLGSVL